MKPRSVFRTVGSVVALCVLWSAPAAWAEDAHLTDAERQELVDLLQDSYSEFEALVLDVEGEEWTAKPAEDRWSVGEVAEHLLLAEKALFGVIRKAMEAEPYVEWEAVDEKGLDPILTQVPDRSQKVQAPDALQPTGELSREETLRRFAAVREETLAFISDTDAPVKSHVQPNPVVDQANVPQWIAFIAAHNLRHNQQIVEVKEELSR